MKYGFYSSYADEKFGHVVYLNPDGETVIVTYVTDDPLIGYFQYKWEDKKFVGALEKFISSRTKLNNKKHYYLNKLV